MSLASTEPVSIDITLLRVNSLWCFRQRAFMVRQFTLTEVGTTGRGSAVQLVPTGGLAHRVRGAIEAELRLDRAPVHDGTPDCVSLGDSFHQTTIYLRGQAWHLVDLAEHSTDPSGTDLRVRLIRDPRHDAIREDQ